MAYKMNFSNSYAQLNECFYESTVPTPVKAPQLTMWNSRLAEQLMIPPELTNNPLALAEIFSGTVF